MTERTKTRVKDWTPALITWSGTLVAIAVAFYFNTNNNVAAHESKLKTHDSKIESIETTLPLKADIKFVDQMRIEREAQIKTLMESKVDRDEFQMLMNNSNQMLTMLRDLNIKLDNHTQKDR